MSVLAMMALSRRNISGACDESDKYHFSILLSNVQRLLRISQTRPFLSALVGAIMHSVLF